MAWIFVLIHAAGNVIFPEQVLPFEQGIFVKNNIKVKSRRNQQGFWKERNHIILIDCSLNSIQTFRTIIVWKDIYNCENSST